MEKEYETLEAFWPFYLSEHSKETNRMLHFIGTSFGLLFLFRSFYKKNSYLVLCGLAIGYGFSWIGHFIVEKNTPATFKYPLKSFLSDWRMFYLVLTGKIDKEVEELVKNKNYSSES